VDRTAKNKVIASVARIRLWTPLGAILVFMLTFVASSAAQDVHSIAQRVDGHYNALRALQAEFTEMFRGNGMDRTESGTLWIRRPGHMRWEYREPRAKLFVTDGKTAWFYAPGDRQARRTAFKSLEDLRSPLAYLLGRAKLEKEFDGLSLAVDITPKSSGNIVLRGKPRGMGSQLAQVLLEVTPQGRIDRIVAEGQDDAVTEFRFSESKENGAVDAASIDDAHFRFTPPKGVEVVEGGLEE